MGVAVAECNAFTPIRKKLRLTYAPDSSPLRIGVVPQEILKPMDIVLAVLYV